MDGKSQIIEILKDNSDIISDKKRLNGILMDCIPNNKALRNALIISFEEGIVESFQEKDFNRTLFEFNRVLTEDYGLNDSITQEALDIWVRICKTDLINDAAGDIDEQKLLMMKYRLFQISENVESGLIKNYTVASDKLFKIAKDILFEDDK